MSFSALEVRNTKDWLSRVAGDPYLCNMTIPGSHDAGVYGDSLDTRYSPKAFARCQGSNIYNQALAGSRMFDCRVFLKYSKKKNEMVPTMGHFASFAEKWKHGKKITDLDSKGDPVQLKSTGSLGAYGGTFITAVSDALSFVKTYQSEFVILRFSHTYCPEQVGAALDEFLQVGDNASYILTGKVNVARARLSKLRGKVIMVFASEFHKDFSPDNGYLPFHKHEPGTYYVHGLCTCGIYKGSADMKAVYSNVVKAAEQHKSHYPDHLHFVYWQQTMTLGLGDIEKATTAKNSKTLFGGQEKPLTGGAHANLQAYVDEVRTQVDAGKWELPNVISHDFVNPTTCSTIFSLNFPRPG